MVSNYSIQRNFQAANFRNSDMPCVMVWLQGTLEFLKILILQVHVFQHKNVAEYMG